MHNLNSKNTGYIYHLISDYFKNEFKLVGVSTEDTPERSFLLEGEDGTCVGVLESTFSDNYKPEDKISFNETGAPNIRECIQYSPMFISIQGGKVLLIGVAQGKTPDRLYAIYQNIETKAIFSQWVESFFDFYTLSCSVGVTPLPEEVDEDMGMYRTNSDAVDKQQYPERVFMVNYAKDIIYIK